MTKADARLDRPIVVTGASGFLGQALLTHLTASGTPVIGLSRTTRPPSELVKWAVADLVDAGTLDAGIPDDALIFHLGATTTGEADAVRASIVDGTRRLLEVARRKGAQVCHISSLAVIDPRELASTTPLTESARVDPFPERRGGYTSAKIAAEAEIRRFSDSGGEAVIVRPAQLVGPGLRSIPPSVGIAKAGVLWLLGPLAGRIPVIHVADAAAGVVVAAACGATGKTVHLVDRNLSRLELLRALRRDHVTSATLPRVPVGAFARLAAQGVPRLRTRLLALQSSAEWDCSRALGMGWAPDALDPWLPPRSMSND